MRHRKYAKALLVLLAAFLFRVLAQLTQRFSDLPILPPFSEWDTGYMPYPILVVVQLSVAVGLLVTLLRIRSGRMRPRYGVGVGLLVFGSVYFLVMLGRFIIAITGLSEAVFFQLYVPAFFHLVLSSFVLVVGTYHVLGSRAAVDTLPEHS